MYVEGRLKYTWSFNCAVVGVLAPPSLGSAFYVPESGIAGSDHILRNLCPVSTAATPFTCLPQCTGSQCPHVPPALGSGFGGAILVGVSCVSGFDASP